MSDPVELAEQLRTTAAALAALGADELSSQVSRDAIETIERARALMDAAESKLLAQFDQTLGCRAEGFRTTRAWMTQRCQVASATASRRMKVARALPSLPLVADRFTRGALSFDQVECFARALNDRTADAMAEDEEALVALAEGLRPDDFAREMRGWMEQADTDGCDPDPGHSDRSMSLSQSIDSRWFGRLELRSADGAVLKTALEAVMEELWQQEQKDKELDPALERTVGQRRVDALLELIRRGLAANLETAEVQRAALSLLITLEDFQADRGGQTDAGDRVSPAGMDRLTCDSVVTPLGWSLDGVPLSHGRTRRLPTAAQRRAISARDRGCVFPGCDAPPNRCAGHHRRHWLFSLGRASCGQFRPPSSAFFHSATRPAHHPLLHEGGWEFARDEQGRPLWYTPDGNLLDPRPGWSHTIA